MCLQLLKTSAALKEIKSVFKILVLSSNRTMGTGIQSSFFYLPEIFIPLQRTYS